MRATGLLALSLLTLGAWNPQPEALASPRSPVTTTQATTPQSSLYVDVSCEERGYPVRLACYASAIGGTAPYTYTWSPTPQYTYGFAAHYYSWGLCGYYYRTPVTVYMQDSTGASGTGTDYSGYCI